MAKREMLILDRNLVEKIDENRGDVSRAEFIEFCIDSSLDARELEREEKLATERKFAPTRKEVSGYVTGEEFQEFRHGINDLLKSFLNFFITFDLELGTSKTKSFEDLKSRLRTTLEGD